VDFVYVYSGFRRFRYLYAPFLVSCLLQHSLPDLVIRVITNESSHFIITNNGLIEAGNEPFMFLLVFDLNSVQPV